MTKVSRSPARRPAGPRPTALKRYGQNHLVDAGTLQAIVALAGVAPEDVVLEVGAATGVLTRQLLARARVVHAFEIDRRFAPQLDELAAGHPGIKTHFGDALKTDLSVLDPAPTAFVANLPYNIAIPLIMTTVATVPSIGRWALMVQRELGDRLFASPRTKAYAAVSVLVQLSCEREAERAVPRTVFSPRPRVDSTFVVFRRRSPAGVPATDRAAVDRLVRAAFGQRRKLIVNSLTGAAHEGRALTRDDVRRALDDLDLPATTRPEELEPPNFVDLARALGWVEAGSGRRP